MANANVGATDAAKIRLGPFNPPLQSDSMDAPRIAELLAPFLGSNARRLTPNDLDNISTYINVLLRWNARVNLTAIRDPEEIVTRHFGESLFAARHLFPGGRAALQGRASDGEADGALAPEGANGQRPATNDRIAVADVGSGAGFPGVPIKLWAPDISLTLIESNHKKAAFLREVSRAITLTDVNVITARAETLKRTFDVVTLRAVEHFDTVLPTAARLLASQGRLALLIGSTQLSTAQASLCDLTWSDPVPIPLSNSRILVTARRTSQEPN